MKKMRMCILVIIPLLGLFQGCIDIFEADLENEEVNLILPEQDLISQEKIQKFLWSYMPGAIWYELQVASPDFSNMSSICLDTLVESNNFQFTLQPGVYQWRVRALNDGSSTKYFAKSFTIMQ